MKIEKISDNKIKCILTREDLESRQIRISELAYGSEKARQLFRDMLMEAQKRYGFSNEANLPLMIEAIPGGGNTLTVVITKVEDPEELDTRFAKFSPSEEQGTSKPEAPIKGADDITRLFRELLEKGTRSKESPPDFMNIPDSEDIIPTPQFTKKGGRGKKRVRGKDEMPNILRAYSFHTLDEVISASAALGETYKGVNSLYRDSGNYILVLSQSGQRPEQFNKICNILSEYGKGSDFTPARESFLREHGKTVISKKAIQKLRTLE